MYGLDALCLNQKDYNLLETFYKRILRQITHLPTTTATPALYLLTGCLPAEAQHHLATLSLFGRIARRMGSIERELAFRQVAMKDPNSNSWFSNIRRILALYNLPPAITILQSPTTKQAWKRQCTDAVNRTWMTKLKDRAAGMKSLKYLNTDACKIGSVHPVWQCGSDPVQARMAAIHAKLLVQRYPLASSHCAGKRQSPNCPACNVATEDLEHFLLKCNQLQHTRQSNMRIINVLKQEHNVGHDLTPAILDASSIPTITNTDRHLLFAGLRRLCFRLHSERAKIVHAGYADVPTQC